MEKLENTERWTCCEEDWALEELLGSVTFDVTYIKHGLETDPK